LHGRDHDIVGVGAAIGQSADGIANGDALDTFPQSYDASRSIKPGNIGDAGRGRIKAAPLLNIGAIYTGSMDGEKYLAGTWRRYGTINNLQDFRPTGLGDFNDAHGGNFRVRGAGRSS
jgi:hypothetical protein